MARPKTTHQLPPLKLLWPKPQRIRQTGMPLPRALAEYLREELPGLQSEQPRVFYTSRELASYFKIDLKAVGHACKLLQSEGLLVRLRGSSTLLSAVESLPRQKIRGVVAVPVWSYGFCHIRDWRLFHMKLEEALRQYDYVANLIFFGDDANEEKMLKRILMHWPDTVVWYQPLANTLPLLQRLSEGGIRPVLIPDRGVHLPFSSYRVDKFPAIRKAVRQWKKEGVLKITVFCLETLSHDDETLVGLAHSLKIPLTLERVNVGKMDFGQITASLSPRSDQVFVVVDNHLCTMLFRHADQAFRDLIRNHRILLPGYLDSATNQLHGLKADFILTEMEKLAEQIAADIASQNLPVPGQARIVPARYLAHAPILPFASLF